MIYKNFFKTLFTAFLIFLFFGLSAYSQVQIGTTNYTTLKAAFDAINNGTHTGNINIAITGNTTETATAVLNASGTGNANYTSITIYPTGTRTISGNLANAIIQLHGADNVTIDGRANQSGSSRDLTIKNDYNLTSNYAAVIWLDSVASTGTALGAKNNTIKYCNIVGGSSTNSYCYGINTGSSASFTTGAPGMDNLKIQYCNISKCYYGVRIYGVSTTSQYTKSPVIEYNTFGNATDLIGYYALYLYYNDSPKIENNLFNYQHANSSSYAIMNYYSTYPQINYNTFKNTSQAGTYYCLYNYYSSYSTVTYNTVQDLSTASSFYFLYNYQSSPGTANTIQYNKINNVTAGSTAYCIYNYYGPNSNVSYNEITNFTGTSTYGLYIGYSSGATVSYNEFNNMNLGTGTFYGLYLYYSGSSTISYNRWEYINPGYIYLYVYYSDAASIYRNIVGNITSVYGSYGWYNYYSSNTVYEGNLFHSVKGTTTTSSYPVYAFYLVGSTSSGTNTGSGVTIKNNVVYNLTSNNYSATSTSNPIAIYIPSSINQVIQHNSINLYGTQGGSTSSGTLSACLYVSSTSVTGMNIRNNSFSNSLVGGTGSKSYCIYLAGTANISTINYNDYYPSGTYGVLGYLSGDRTTITAWRSATSQDGQSFSSDPSYNANDNLRPKSGSPLVGAGTPISTITVDFLGYTRSTTAPTVGAYEQAGEFGLPDISYTPLSNTASTSNRQFNNVSITDASGINTSTYKPRLYYKKITDANTYVDNTSSTNGWKYVETTSSSSPFAFTIDYSKLYGGTGVQVNDAIQYFVVAQDLATTPNVAINSGRFNQLPSNVALTSSQFPIKGKINQYFIGANLSGTVYVGSGQTFTSLTNEGGFFQTLERAVLQSNVTVLITSDITNESGMYSAKQWSEEGTGNYTVTIAPNAASERIISGSAGGGLIKINQVSRIIFDGSYNNSGRYLNFQNNSTGSNTAVFHFISNGTNMGCTNSAVKNCKIYAGINTTSSTFGIYLGGSSISTSGTGADNDNITIQNNIIRRAYYAIYARGVATTGQLDNLNIIANKIGSDISTDYVAYRGIDIQNATAPNVTQNIIFNMKTNPSTNIAAMEFGQYVADATITRNRIYGIYNMNTGGWGAYGINFTTSTGVNNNLIANNVIYDILTVNYSGTTYNPFGIRILGGTNYKILYNSVHLFGEQGTSSYTGTVAACLLITSTAVTGTDLRNNVFASGIKGATGTKSYCIYLAGTGNLTSSTLNYNDYYPYGDYGVLGYMGADYTSITAWRSATSQEGNSFSSNPNFNADNFLRPLANSPLGGAGTPLINVTNDHLNVTRSTTAPTVGAYEQLGDFIPPKIEYTLISNSTSTSNRTLTDWAKITDYTGVNTTPGTRPRLYYKKSTNANTYVDNTSATNGWKWVEASGTGDSPFSFTIDYSKLYGGAPALWDKIDYFVVAQDITSYVNVGIQSGQFNEDYPPSSVALTSSAFPIEGIINQYQILPAYSGNYYVGSGQTYTSLTGAGGFFEALNQGVLTGNVIVNVTSNLTETGLNALNQISEEFGTGYTITIRPNAAATRTISGSYAGGLIRFNGADNVIFDGSYNGSGRYFTVSNTSTSSYNAVFQFISQGSNLGAKNNTIKNCNINCYYPYYTSYCVYMGGTGNPGAAAGADNDNNTFENNVFNKAWWGIYSNGVSSNKNDNLVIKNNTFGLSSAYSWDYNWIGMDAVHLLNCDNVDIYQNTFQGNYPSNGYDYAAIYLGSGVTNTKVQRNVIKDMYKEEGYNRIAGVHVTTGTDANILLANNMVFNLLNNCYYSDFFYGNYGFFIEAGSGIKIYHNSINLYGNRDDYAYEDYTYSPSACVCIAKSVGVDMRNNIFKNTMTVYDYNPYTPYSYSVYKYESTTPFTESNYNDYYVSGRWGILGYYGRDISSLSAWQSATGKDGNSVNVNPIWLSDNDLHLDGNSVTSSDFFCPSVGITDDIDNETRRTTNLHKGCDCVRPIIKFDPDLTIYTQIFCPGDRAVFTYTPKVDGFIDGIKRTVNPTFTHKWFKDGNEISGVTTNNYTINNVSLNDKATYQAEATTIGESAITRESELLVEAPLAFYTHPQSGDVCINDPAYRMFVDAGGTLTGYQWQKQDSRDPNIFNDIPGATNSEIYIPLDNPNQAVGVYRCKIIGPGNCGPKEKVSNTASITMYYPAKITSITPNLDPSSLCAQDNFKMTVNATGTIYGYQWQYFKNNVWTDLSLGDYPTARSNTLEIYNIAVSQSGDYRCIVYGSPICNTEVVISDPIKLIVFPLFEIKEQPKSLTICVGDQILLSLIAEGTIFSYQWQKNGEDIDVGKNPTAASPMFIIPTSIMEDAGLYKCVLHIEDCKGNRYVSTDEVLVYINRSTKITNPPKTQPAQLGGRVQFEFEADVAGNPVISWYRGNVKLVNNDRYAGTNSSIMSIRDIQTGDIGDDYWVKIDGLCGSDNSPNFGIILPTINILTQPVDQSVCVGQTVNLQVDAQMSGGATKILYQWRNGNKLLYDDNRISGAKTPNLTIKDIKPSDASIDYNCLITVLPGNFTFLTRYVVLDVKIPPTITRQPPSSLVVENGRLLVIRIKAEGTNISYQWYKDNQEIPGATNEDIRIANVTADNAGVYYCKVTNDCGEVTSDYCTVTISSELMLGIEDNAFNQIALLGNEPNPFSDKTSIKFYAQDVVDMKLIITDIFGKEVAILLDGKASPGINTVTFNSTEYGITSGIYYVTIVSNGLRYTKPMILIK